MIELLNSEKTQVEDISANSTRDLWVICERLFLDVKEDMTKTQLATLICEELKQNPSWLLKMLQEKSIQVLFELWEFEQTEELMSGLYGEYLNQLHYLGLVRLEGKEKVYVNMEAKDYFFFALKSHRAKEKMKQYAHWEQIIFGMFYYYGILELSFCYNAFTKLLDLNISFDEFQEFLLVRIVFWQSASVLQNQKTKEFYFASREVRETNEVFYQWNEQKDLPFKLYEEDDYLTMAMSNGIGNWEGIRDMFLYVLEKVEQDRYKAMFFMKSMVLMIQNGDTFVEVFNKTEVGIEQDEEERKEFREWLRAIFYHTPIYKLKGHSRHDIEDAQRGEFHMILGGKKN